MIGQALGHYRIEQELGAGGMGVVYLATDSKLGRQVAIKVLPESFARQPERLARFEREARMLASLNHPNIAAVHGLEECGGVHYLILELVPGLTLAKRIAGGSLPIGEALGVSRQIAAALEAAHEKAIVHRDLKPANVKITPEGKVKVLDFGLAKALEAPASDDPCFSQSPTVTAERTEIGTVLGTAAYMSPEQARGRPVDKRTDIWAFGCVLFESLTRQRAFAGKTTSDCIAAVLAAEPDWDTLPASTPANIGALVRRCLEKDPQRRLRDIGDAGIESMTRLAAETAARSLLSGRRHRSTGYWQGLRAGFWQAPWWLCCPCIHGAKAPYHTESHDSPSPSARMKLSGRPTLRIWRFHRMAAKWRIARVDKSTSGLSISRKPSPLPTAVAARLSSHPTGNGWRSITCRPKRYAKSPSAEARLSFFRVRRVSLGGLGARTAISFGVFSMSCSAYPPPAAQGSPCSKQTSRAASDSTGSRGICLVGRPSCLPSAGIILRVTMTPRSRCCPSRRGKRRS